MSYVTNLSKKLDDHTNTKDLAIHKENGVNVWFNNVKQKLSLKSRKRPPLKEISAKERHIKSN